MVGNFRRRLARGLREGCPSSPILFNIFHDSLMEVFRARRQRAAEPQGLQPGLPWIRKIDGRASRRKTNREDEGRHLKRVRVEVFACADDTAIAGIAEEATAAESIFIAKVSDFSGKVSAHKTESIRVEARGRSLYEVARIGEKPAVQHVGTLLSERAGHNADTTRAVKKGFQRIEQIAAAWPKGPQAHGRRRDLKLSVRIRVLPWSKEYCFLFLGLGRGKQTAFSVRISRFAGLFMYARSRFGVMA